MTKLDNVSYKCINCDKIYCTLCFLNDEHIKKDIIPYIIFYSTYLNIKYLFKYKILII